MCVPRFFIDFSLSVAPTLFPRRSRDPRVARSVRRPRPKSPRAIPPAAGTRVRPDLKAAEPEPDLSKPSAPRRSCTASVHVDAHRRGLGGVANRAETQPPTGPTRISSSARVTDHAAAARVVPPTSRSRPCHHRPVSSGSTTVRPFQSRLPIRTFFPRGLITFSGFRTIRFCSPSSRPLSGPCRQSNP